MYRDDAQLGCAERLVPRWQISCYGYDALAIRGPCIVVQVALSVRQAATVTGLWIDDPEAVALVFLLEEDGVAFFFLAFLLFVSLLLGDHDGDQLAVR